MIGSVLMYLLARICCNYYKFVPAYLLADVSYKIYSLVDIVYRNLLVLDYCIFFI